MKVFVVVLGALMVLGGCGDAPRPADDPSSPAESSLRQQLEVEKDKNEALRLRLTELAPWLDLTPRDEPQKCPTRLGAIEREPMTGTTCADLAVNIGGWSEACIADGPCDTAARLKEVNARAEEECKAFCLRAKCEVWSYTPSDHCGAVICEKEGLCPEGCPTTDACLLMQTNAQQNCRCRLDRADPA